jgi:hypothetical protein
MIEFYYNELIARLEGFGMPVAFLKAVAKKYSFHATSKSSHVNTFWNTLNLKASDISTMKTAVPGGTTGEVSTIGTIYHESTHAYLDIRENEKKFEDFVTAGVRYYDGAKLKGGSVSSDPDRLFQEAAGCYVGYRASQWYSVCENIELWREAIHERTWEGRGNPAFYDLAAATVRNFPVSYDVAMRERVFGYEGDAQYFTIQPVSARIKAFCDHEILEDKISDTFESSGLKDRHQSLADMIESSRTIVPFEAIDGRR